MAALALISSTFVSGSASAEESSTIAKPIDGSSVGIQMFGWNWVSLASECTKYLGPNGFDWILTLPPQDHIRGNAWWTHFQPVSYQLNSDAGTPEQFAQMVSSCNQAGVKVITDAVINHMAGRSGFSFSGVEYGDGNFGTLYSKSDFHYGLDKSDPHFCDTNIWNWDEFDDRTNCQFPGLPDLATEKPEVRKKIAEYLNSQLRLGVSGFRIDAAKHIPPADLAAIKQLLIRDAYIVQEIPGDTSIANEYLGTGDVWAWGTSQFATRMFEADGQASFGSGFSKATKSYPLASQALSWVTNHDTEHHGGAVTYGEGRLYPMAFAWILSEPYGKPMLYSGYTFFDDSFEAPQDVSGLIKNPVCASSSGPKYEASAGWRGNYEDGVFTCVQRWVSIRGMIAWRDSVGAAAKVASFTKPGVYGFSRAGSGFVVFNSKTSAHGLVKVKTSLPAGTYCDFYTGGKKPIKVAKKSCVGLSIVVAKGGLISGKVPALSVLAISKASKLK